MTARLRACIEPGCTRSVRYRGERCPEHAAPMLADPTSPQLFEMVALRRKIADLVEVRAGGEHIVTRLPRDADSLALVATGLVEVLVGVYASTGRPLGLLLDQLRTWPEMS